MSIKTKIRSLIDAANAETGKDDADLTTAVQSLIDGYGTDNVVTDDDIINLLYETGFINPVTNNSGKILLASDNNILTL